jgi:superfamily I DNA and RNA helicase
MERKVKTIRDLTLVEKELGSANAGVLSVSLMKERFTQFAVAFVYHNKNIFLYLDNEELLRSIRLDSPAKFTILKDKNVSKDLIEKKDTLYRLFSIVVTGSIREAEEQKTIKEIAQSFIQKYSGKLLYSDKDNQPKGKLLFVDSEELLAYDEIGF